MRYAQIEKEALVFVFACEKFHQFVYGRRILVETDHRPLISIAQKSVKDMPPRLQRFFIRLLKYDCFAVYPRERLAARRYAVLCCHTAWVH